MILFFTNCNSERRYTEKQMFNLAHKEYTNYLFEFGIDSTHFSNSIFKKLSNDTISYKWIAKNNSKDTIGIEVKVPYLKRNKPELILFGNWETWHSFYFNQDK